eukprot:8379693-Prorocentrum_lima.AAC.1
MRRWVVGVEAAACRSSLRVVANSRATHLDFSSVSTQRMVRNFLPLAYSSTGLNASNSSMGAISLS